MYILLSESKRCGKTETLKIIHAQMNNLYSIKISSCNVFEDSETFKTETIIFNKKIAILENNKPIEEVFNEISKSPTPPDVVIVETHSDDNEFLEQNGIEFITIKKEIRDNEKRYVFSNINDCEKVLNIIEKYLTTNSN